MPDLPIPSENALLIFAVACLAVYGVTLLAYSSWAQHKRLAQSGATLVFLREMAATYPAAAAATLAFVAATLVAAGT